MLRTPWLLAAVASAWLVPAAGASQTVLVRVLASESSSPVFGALAYLDDGSGSTVKNALTDERGRALFVGIPAGSYRVRVEMIGMATAETALFDVSVGMSVAKDVRLESSAIELEGIEVAMDGGRCRVRPGGEGLAIADVWDEARKALSAAAFTDERGAYRYETVIYTRDLDLNLAILDESESRREGYMKTPFESLPAEDLVQDGFVQPDGRDQIYYAPDAGVLLSDAFLDTHCFRLARGSDETTGLLGLGFEPTGENRRVVDIAGTMWLDEETAELRWLEYTYRYLDPDILSSEIGGRVDFRRMPGGTWIVPEWWIRMPALAERVDQTGFRQRYVNGFRQTGGRVLEVREAGGRSLGRRVTTGGFEGVVMDSVGVPVRGARVGVIGSNQESYSNAEGRYSITGLEPGRYQVRFVDPTLELVGFTPPTVTRDVIRGEATTLDYHMPSVGDVLFEGCRDTERPEGSSILAGTVRDGGDRPVTGATVRVEWSTFQLRAGVGGVVSVGGEVIDGFTATTDEAGFYRFCGVPTDHLIRVSGTHGDVESEVYDVRIPIDRFAVLRPIRLGR